MEGVIASFSSPKKTRQRREHLSYTSTDKLLAKISR